MLIDADATDPTAIGNAVAALGQAVADLNRDLPPIRQTQPQTPPFQFVVHARYNPEQLTVLNIVPGLICIVLMFSTLFVTTLAITKERERGTMENLLAMPVRPIEVMIAKIVPYVVIGYIQVDADPGRGVDLLRACRSAARCRCCSARSALFIASNLALGVTFSTVAANQMQAVQLAQFTLMPSFMLSGFMFPFRGMPVWAQCARRGLSDHPRHAHRARHAAQRERLDRDRAGALADGAVHRGGHRLRRAGLSRDARLSLDRARGRRDAVQRKDPHLVSLRPPLDRGAISGRGFNLLNALRRQFPGDRNCQAAARRAPSTTLRVVPLPRFAIAARGRRRGGAFPPLRVSAGEGDHAKHGGGGVGRRAPAWQLRFAGRPAFGAPPRIALRSPRDPASRSVATATRPSSLTAGGRR